MTGKVLSLVCTEGQTQRAVLVARPHDCDHLENRGGDDEKDNAQYWSSAVVFRNGESIVCHGSMLWVSGVPFWASADAALRNNSNVMLDVNAGHLEI